LAGKDIAEADFPFADPDMAAAGDAGRSVMEGVLELDAEDAPRDWEG
jgi:hypothetical protein